MASDHKPLVNPLVEFRGTSAFRSLIAFDIARRYVNVLGYGLGTGREQR